MINNLPRKLKEDIVAGYNYFIHSNKVPEHWKKFTVVPILKPSKDGSEISHYRPIVLASIIRKTLEKILALRLTFFLEKNKLWPQTQFGFRPGYSTINNLSILLTDISNGFLQKQITETLFLDIHQAYDHVSISYLTGSLEKLRIPAQLILFLRKLLMNRTLHLKNEQDNNREAYTGLPRGSSLSTVLYVMYTAELEKTSNSRILQFADDVVVYDRTERRKIQETDFQRNITRTVEWLKERNLDINTQKSTYIIFSTSNNITNFNKTIKVFNKHLFPQQTTKFLGLHLQYNLKWNIHREMLVNYINKTHAIFKYLAGRWWGTTIKELRILFFGLIQAKLEYRNFLMKPQPTTNHQDR